MDEEVLAITVEAVGAADGAGGLVSGVSLNAVKAELKASDELAVGCVGGGSAAGVSLRVVNAELSSLDVCAAGCVGLW